MSRVPIDLNVRAEGNQTYAWVDDITDGQYPPVGAAIEAFERESGLAFNAWVARYTEDLVYLDVDWSQGFPT